MKIDGMDLFYKILGDVYNAHIVDLLEYKGYIRIDYSHWKSIKKNNKFNFEILIDNSSNKKIKSIIFEHNNTYCKIKYLLPNKNIELTEYQKGDHRLGSYDKSEYILYIARQFKKYFYLKYDEKKDLSEYDRLTFKSLEDFEFNGKPYKRIRRSYQQMSSEPVIIEKSIRIRQTDGKNGAILCNFGSTSLYRSCKTLNGILHAELLDESDLCAIKMKRLLVSLGLTSIHLSYFPTASSLHPFCVWVKYSAKYESAYIGSPIYLFDGSVYVMVPINVDIISLINSLHSKIDLIENANHLYNPWSGTIWNLCDKSVCEVDFCITKIRTFFNFDERHVIYPIIEIFNGNSFLLETKVTMVKNPQTYWANININGKDELLNFVFSTSFLSLYIEGNEHVYTYKNTIAHYFEFLEENNEDTLIDMLKTQTIDYQLKWEDIIFDEKRYLLFPHLENVDKMQYDVTPFVVKNQLSRESFNYIKSYFSNRIQLPLIQIKFSNEKGNIIINNEIDFENVLYFMDKVFISDNLAEVIDTYRKEKQKEEGYNFKSAIDKSVLLNRVELKRYKSDYIDYLAECQLAEYRIIPCKESFSHENAVIIEDSFIFIISSAEKYLMAAFENVNPRRSTIFFVINKKNYLKNLEQIYMYMVSRENNKRTRIRDNMVSICKSNLNYFTLNHNDFNSWRRKIINLKINLSNFEQASYTTALQYFAELVLERRSY